MFINFLIFRNKIGIHVHFYVKVTIILQSRFTLKIHLEAHPYPMGITMSIFEKLNVKMVKCGCLP